MNLQILSGNPSGARKKAKKKTARKKITVRKVAKKKVAKKVARKKVAKKKVAKKKTPVLRTVKKVASKVYASKAKPKKTVKKKTAKRKIAKKPTSKKDKRNKGTRNPVLTSYGPKGGKAQMTITTLTASEKSKILQAARTVAAALSEVDKLSKAQNITPAQKKKLDMKIRELKSRKAQIDKIHSMGARLHEEELELQLAMPKNFVQLGEKHFDNLGKMNISRILDSSITLAEKKAKEAKKTGGKGNLSATDKTLMKSKPAVSLSRNIKKVKEVQAKIEAKKADMASYQRQVKALRDKKKKGDLSVADQDKLLALSKRKEYTVKDMAKLEAEAKKAVATAKRSATALKKKGMSAGVVSNLMGSEFSTIADIQKVQAKASKAKKEGEREVKKTKAVAKAVKKKTAKKKAAKKTSKKVAKKASKKVAKKASKKTSKVSSKKTAKKASKKTAKKASKKTSKKTSKKVAKKPALSVANIKKFLKKRKQKKVFVIGKTKYTVKRNPIGGLNMKSTGAKPMDRLKNIETYKQSFKLDMYESAGLALGGALHETINDVVNRIPMVGEALSNEKTFGLGDGIKSFIGSGLLRAIVEVAMSEGKTKNTLRTIAYGVQAASVAKIGADLYTTNMKKASMSGLVYKSDMGALKYTPDMGRVNYTPDMGAVNFTPDMGTIPLESDADFGAIVEESNVDFGALADDHGADFGALDTSMSADFEGMGSW